MVPALFRSTKPRWLDPDHARPNSETRRDKSLAKPTRLSMSLVRRPYPPKDLVSTAFAGCWKGQSAFNSIFLYRFVAHSNITRVLFLELTRGHCLLHPTLNMIWLQNLYWRKSGYNTERDKMRIMRQENRTWAPVPYTKKPTVRKELMPIFAFKIYFVNDTSLWHRSQDMLQNRARNISRRSEFTTYKPPYEQRETYVS